MAKVAPLSWQTPIVDADSGKPTSFFIRLWQQLFAIQYIRIVADRTIVKYDASGNATPLSQTTTFTASKTNSADTTEWSLKDNLGNPLSITAYTTGSDTDVVTMTRPQFDAALAVNGASGIRIIASVVDAGETFRDEAMLTKVQDGATGTGADAHVLTVYSDRQQITYDGAGNPSPVTQTTTFSTNKVNTSATVFWTIQDLLGNNLTPVTSYLSANSGDSVTMTRAQFASAIAVNGARGVVVTGTLTDGGTWTHRISVVKVQAGADGLTGATGPTGPSGAASYLHTAYSDAADGSVNFTISDVPAGRTYIGFYVDTTAADSTNPASYNWSQFVGEDGSTGSPGLNGYVHRAYADSADGSVNFTTGSPGSRGYIGWYQDNTLADSGSYTSYTWSKFVGSTGPTGSTGSPGVTPLSISALPNPISVACTFNGTPKAAIPSFTAQVLQGISDVTGSVTWSFTSAGLTGPSRSGAVFSATGMTADTATMTITATYSGTMASYTVTYTKTKDGSAYVSDIETIGAPPSTTNTVVSSSNLLMGPAGTLDIDLNGTFNRSPVGVINVSGFVEYSLNGGGSWTTLGTFTGNASTSTIDGDFTYTGSYSGGSIGLTAKQSVIIQVQMRKSTSSSFGSFGGVLGVSWTG